MKERRLTIDGFDDYQASENGYIVNVRTGRILKASPDRCGYSTVHLAKDGDWYTKRVHRLIGETFLEQPDPESWQINHINGDKNDNRLCNLEFVSPGANMRHAYANGLNHWEGYNETPIRVIETGKVYRSQAECARAIGGSQPNINACLMGRRNKHLGYHFEYADEMEI